MFQQRFDYLRLPQQIANDIIVTRKNALLFLLATNIKDGTGQNAIRKIFKIQDYDQFERMQISSFVQTLQKNQIYDPNVHPDSLLLRYLYANKFDIKSSLDQLAQTSNILFQPGYLDLSNEVEALYYKGAIYIEGRTRNHIPCIVISTKLVDDLALFERAAVILCAIIEDYMLYPGKVENWIAVIQTKDQSAFKMPLDKISQIIKVLQTCFPNTCECIYILNTTLSINLLWSQIEEQIDPVTLNKIRFLKDKELSILSNQFDPEHLEQSLGGQKIMQSYWPPDPNDYIYDLPQQQPIYEEEEPQVFFSQPTNNLQYLNQAPPLEKEIQPPPPINNQISQPIIIQQPIIVQQPQQPPQTEKKKKCICVKCSRDLEEVASQPRQPKLLESQNIEKKQPSQQKISIQETKGQTGLDDTYVPYERKYESVLNDSLLINPQNENEQKLQENSQNNKPQFGGNSFNINQNQQQQIQTNQISNKPTFNNPFYGSDSIKGSQQLGNKQIPQSSNKVSQEIQANMDDLIINDKPDYEPKYINKNSRQYQTSQSSRFSNNSPNLYNFINVPSYNPLNQSLYSQVPATQQYPSQQYIPTIPFQPQSQQQITNPIRNDDVVQQQPVHVQEYDNNFINNQSYYAPQISSDPKKKYDFSQWDKYNDINDPFPVKSYISPSNDYVNPYLSSSPYKNNVVNVEDYNQLYDNTGDYKPGEFQPSTYNFTPYDYKYSDQQYQPRVEGTTKSNGAPQLYQQKPGQQACEIF